MQEIELKFLVPSNKLTALKRQTHIKSSITSTLSAHYFDTAEQHLATAGVAIRIRQEGVQPSHDSQKLESKWIQTIKANGDGLASRLEHNHTLDISNNTIDSTKSENSVNSENPTDTEEDSNQSNESEAIHPQRLMPDFSVYKDTPIAPLLKKLAKKQKLTKDTLNENLIRLYVTDVTRTTRLIKKEDSVIEVAYDLGEVIHGTHPEQKQAIHELEFELLTGDNRLLFDTAKVWCKRYNLCLSTITKAERGSLLLANQLHPKAVKADIKTLTIDKHISQPAFMRAVVHNCLLQILPNASAIASGSVEEHNANDADNQSNAHVHQLRVGIRRLRTAIKLFAGFSEDINPDWMPILKQTFALLGDYRDREILKTKTQPMLESVGSPHVEWEMDVKVMPIDAVCANDFQITLLELIEFAMSDSLTESNQKPAHAKVSKILNRLFVKIAKASGEFASLELEAQHDVRKRLKALRYISEFASPMYKNKATKAFIQYLEPAQDVLGDYNDNLVGHDFYAQKALTQPNAYFAVGWFLAREQESAKVCAKSLKTVKDAPRFW